MVLLKIQSYVVINCYKNDAGSVWKINDTGARRKDNETVIGSDLMVSNPRWYFSFLFPALLSLFFFFFFPSPGILSRERFPRVLEGEKKKRRKECLSLLAEPIGTIHSCLRFTVKSNSPLRSLKTLSRKLWKYKSRITLWSFIRRIRWKRWERIEKIKN